ncbi:aromatic ring-hydroxylating dioxygenase subunit alpha [Nostoc sp. C117]|uniref:aromatic ring-hydroxylating oxygenase subunit alpha n=1 Tax=Nostoc sp. C117 TaxID=3349875 RepID=UPI00370D4EB7
MKIGNSSNTNSNSLDDWSDRLTQGWTLPSVWYSEPTLLKQEQTAIFQRTWQYAGNIQSLTQPGDYLTHRCGDVPILIVQNAANELRAFINICRHRACEVAFGAGNTRMFQCPYHAWRYDLDGVLQVVPGYDLNPELDLTSLGLLPVKVDTWGSFIFVNLDSEAEPLATHLGILPELLLSSGVNIEKLRSQQKFVSEMSVNWKVIAENYLECYHCTFNHPSLLKILDPDAYALSAVGNALIGKVPMRQLHSRMQSNASPYCTDGDVKESLFVLLWPNCTFTVMPGQGNLTVYTFNPVTPQQTHTFCEYFFDGDADETFIERFIDFDNRVGQEDVKLLESVQAGLQSGAMSHGRLLLDREWLIQYFQKLVYRSLTEVAPATT